MRFDPNQKVNDVVYANSDKSPNLETYKAPSLAVNGLSNQYPIITKS